MDRADPQLTAVRYNGSRIAALEDINLIALAIPVFFAMIAVELYVARQQGRDVYRFNDAVTDLSCGITQQATGVFVKVIPFAAYVLVYDNLRFWDWEGIAPWLIAFVGVDFFYYWWHRFTHEVNVGWATHVVHHQSEDYNLAVALRQTLTSSLSSGPFYLPLAIIGVHPVIFGTMNAISTLYQFWIHTETVRDIGPLEWVLNTPAHHRVHHGTNPQYLDKNYGAILIVWDRLFRTFEPEGEEVVYGTVKPLGSFNPLWANFYYFGLLIADSRATPDWTEKVKVWFKPPGYRPPGLPQYPDPPEVSREAQAKYDPEVPTGINGYVLAHFIPVAIALTAMLWFEETAAASTMGVVMTVIVATTVAWGGLFERKSWALSLEFGRLLAIGAIGSVWLAGDPAWSGAVIALWIGVVGSAGWLLQYRGLYTEPQPA